MVEADYRIRKEFGTFLKNARLKAKITQKKIATNCGYTNPQYISNIERGECWPPINILVEMAKAYGISKSEMLEKLVFYRRKVWAMEMGLQKRRSPSA